jgi:hypothetical protein
MHSHALLHQQDLDFDLPDVPAPPKASTSRAAQAVVNPFAGIPRVDEAAVKE